MLAKEEAATDRLQGHCLRGLGESPTTHPVAQVKHWLATHLTVILFPPKRLRTLSGMPLSGTPISVPSSSIMRWMFYDEMQGIIR
ncbi:hypothetical protein PAAG_11313 [Paracoccidioides lutzii Pb01]|uniref:Uncharacterized protein n=1 Tax=Paracoccidioides lutzii (strain ATCC MYA-826 / Pb01) TaxID=502779 RepID=A0A0A2V348_PARBA|nr:hypothetical protein PAAG_11313 [Paracoccidioides lutzii Pb01]KGQ01923.1 hypothetical protein PAAG_11313 [Paracoccidioides lutzii Pb01]